MNILNLPNDILQIILNKVDINLLPKYILENKDKLKKWIEN